MSKSDDLISRQAAIDAILAVTGNSSVRELYEHVQEHGLSEMWSGGVNAAIDIIIAVPSVQPKPAIPLQWIEAQIEWLKSLDNAFSALTAGQISAMVNKWKDEQDG